MNVSELRKIIHEEVSKAIREEFREILLEAVQNQTTEGRHENYKPASLSCLEPQLEESPRLTSISEMLEETARGMNREDYRNIFGEGKTLSSNMVGQVQSPVTSVAGMPDIITRAAGKAKAVLDTSFKKDQERHGL